MITTVRLWFSTIRTTLTNLRALAVFAIIYALLLLSAYFFISTREATVWQVFVTYALLILLPAEFFIFQASIIDHVRDQEFRWRAILFDALRFFLATIPVLLIVWLLYFLLNKLAGRFPAPIVPTLPIAPGPAPPGPLHWPTLIFATLRFVLLGVALPLATIHLWIEVAACNLRESLRSGAKIILGRLGRRFSLAFASESVLIYALGLLVFFVLPYIILVPTFAIKGNKTEFAVFVLRLVVSFALTLIGWVVTISALTKLSFEESPKVSPKPVPEVSAEAPA